MANALSGLCASRITCIVIGGDDCRCVHGDKRTAELADDENFDTDATQLGLQAGVLAPTSS